MWSSSAGQDARARHIDDLAGSLGPSCVRGASLEETLGEDSPLATSMPAIPATEVHLRTIEMLWTGRSCRRGQCWLWRKRKRATGPASASKLRQNRFKYRTTIDTKVQVCQLDFPCIVAAEPVKTWHGIVLLVDAKAMEVEVGPVE